MIRCAALRWDYMWSADVDMPRGDNGWTDGCAVVSEVQYSHPSIYIHIHLEIDRPTIHTIAGRRGIELSIRQGEGVRAAA